MATGNGATPEQQEEQDRRPTERVILQRVQALPIPEGVTAEAVTEAAKLLKVRGRVPLPLVVWTEVDRKTAATKKAAIEAYAGKAGTPDAKAGEYRAPSLTAWKGGLRLVAPPKPLIEAEVFE